MSQSKQDSYQFPWDAFEIVLSGRSALDVGFAFHSATPEEARAFFSSYGYDLTNPIEAAEAQGHFQEALNFIRKFFLKPENPEGLALEIPRRIQEVKLPEELLLIASSSSEKVILKLWVCAILKVMHTLAHMDQDARVSIFGQIQTQLLDPYYRLIERDELGHMVFAKTVSLVAFESKPKKSRESLLIKLLHKPENVAEDVFDRVGIRFVTGTKLDALRLVKCLIDMRVIIPPNLKPSRSRNSLVDITYLRKALSDVDLNSPKTEALLNELLDKHRGINESVNQHTQETYRSIQFTCRQLIKLTNPLYKDLRNFKLLAKNIQGLPAEVTMAVDKIDLSFIARESRFFYPYEVQVVDRLSHEENEKGRSAHSEYKKAQLQTALKRVMGPLARAHSD